MKAKDWFLEFARGASLGTGILPGVSVGTVGIIVGVYDRLLGYINDLRHHFKKAFLGLLPIALGCLITAVALLYGYDKAKDYILFELVCLFAGCILGSLPIITSEVKKEKISKFDVLRIVGGFVLAAGIGVASAFSPMSFETAFLNPNQNWWVYPITLLVGFVAAVACLLPGISGSMVLFIFGLYTPVVDLFMGDNSIFHNHDRLASGLILILLLLVGVIIGLFAISKLMAKLLDKHRHATYTLVLGFVLGSLVSMFINNQIYPAYPTFKWYDYLIGGIAFVGCTCLFYFLIKKKQKTALSIDLEK